MSDREPDHRRYRGLPPKTSPSPGVSQALSSFSSGTFFKYDALCLSVTGEAGDLVIRATYAPLERTNPVAPPSCPPAAAAADGRRGGGGGGGESGAAQQPEQSHCT